MKKRMFKQFSILLSLLLALSFIGPLGALAQDNNEVFPTPKVVVTVERSTIGQGFFIEPTLVDLAENDTAYDLLAKVVEPENIIGDSRVVTGIKGADQGLETITIPDYIVDDLAGPDTDLAKAYGNDLEEMALGTNSYSDQGHWICLVNNKPLTRGWGLEPIEQGDILRFAFSYWGAGADVTGFSDGEPEPAIEIGNKDDLIKTMALINEEPYLLNSPFINEAYSDALIMLAEAPIEQVAIDAFTAVLEGTVASYDINSEYKTHIENQGWEKDWVLDNNLSGTTGDSLRLEGIQIKLQDNPLYDVDVRYKTHIENQGWEEAWTENGDPSGTEGKALRLEAIKIELTGDHADLFDVYYQVHAQDVGWMDVAQNGDPAGTQGFGRRLEAIHIEVVPKGLAPFVRNEPVGPAFQENK